MTPTGSASSPSLAPEARRELLRLARAALEDHLGSGATSPGKAAPLPALEETRGVFVTLRRDEELLGCIGWVTPDEPLRLTVPRCAVAAATEDPRFPPVRGEDLEEIRIEISVLSPMEPVQSVEEIAVGRDGLLIEAAGRRGLLLPQVAVEQGWNRKELLEGVCRKAGLPPGAWNAGGTLWRFTADVAGEL